MVTVPVHARTSAVDWQVAGFGTHRRTNQNGAYKAMRFMVTLPGETARRGVDAKTDPDGPMHSGERRWCQGVGRTCSFEWSGNVATIESPRNACSGQTGTGRFEADESAGLRLAGLHAPVFQLLDPTLDKG